MHIKKLDSEQFNSCGGDEDMLSTINISMSTSEPQLPRQSIENFNNLLTDEQYYDYIDQHVQSLMSTPKTPQEEIQNKRWLSVSFINHRLPLCSHL